MVSLQHPKNQSSHGRALLLELRDCAHAKIDFVLDCLNKDPLSGRLKCTETGNNAYHWLLSGTYHKDFILKVLSKLLEVCPEGVRAINNHGSLPLHLCFARNQLHREVIDIILQAYPAGAGLADSQGLIPLFLCCMREDSHADYCKALCKAFPNGPSTKNKTNSYPLHFAAKRLSPNLEILGILIRRFPAAASAVNDFGLLPLHCICALSNNLKAVELIHNADPDAVKVPDRQGRTCLHLAALHVGKEHSTAVQLEEEEMRLQAQLAQAQRSGGGKEDAAVDAYSDGSDNEEGGDSNTNKQSELTEREGGASGRAVVRYLATAFPPALCMENNFQATPVDTMLERIKPVRSKNKVVSVYGLYNDPPTARMLLMAQRNRSRAYNAGRTLPPNTILLPNLRPRYFSALREFNWLARKDVLCVSLLGEARYCTSTVVKAAKGKDKLTPQLPKGTVLFSLRLDASCPLGGTCTSSKDPGSAGGKKAGGSAKGGKSTSAAAGKGATKKLSAEEQQLDTVFSNMTLTANGTAGSEQESSAEQGSGGDAMLRGNLLALLRSRGMGDLVRSVIAFI